MFVLIELQMTKSRMSLHRTKNMSQNLAEADLG